MKPARFIGFGFLLLFFNPQAVTSDESESPFSPLPHEQNLLVFERAEQAPTLLDWLQVVDPQLADASSWERERLLEEYEIRLAGWFHHGWTNTLSTPAINTFLKQINEAHRLYSVSTEEEGGAAAQYGQAGYEQDHRAWQEHLQSSMEELLEKWETSARSTCQELIAKTDPTFRAEVASAATISLKQYREEVRREFERLYRQAESRFIRSRLADSHDRKQNVQTPSAGELARALIERTHGELEQNSVRLDVYPDQAAEHRQGAIVLDVESWQQDFVESFERGLEAWNQAEQSFLAERIRWENDARSCLLASQESWQQAFAEFEQARQSWMGEMQLRFEEGTRAWEQAESDFALQYESVMEQLAVASQLELQALSDELNTFLDVYHRNVELKRFADTNIELLQKEIEELEMQDSSRAETIQALQQELAYWQGEDGRGGMRAEYLQGCSDAKQTILDLEASIRGYGGDDLPASSLEKEIARLQAELEYLGKQVDAAQALVNYSREYSATLSEQEKAAAAVSEARIQMSAAETSYRTAAAALNDFLSGELSQSMEALAEARRRLETAETAFKQARQHYEENYHREQEHLDDYDPAEINLLRREMEVRELEAKACAEDYRESLTEYNKSSDRYLKLQAELEPAFQAYRQAQHDLQIAEDIYDFVNSIGGYEGLVSDPQSTLTLRIEAYQRTADALELLRSILAGANDGELVRQLAPEYKELKDKELAELNSLEYLLFAYEQLQGSTRELLSRQISSMEDLSLVVQDTFSFSFSSETGQADRLVYSPQLEDFDTENLTMESLTAFPSRNEGTLALQVSEYFTGDAAEVAERYSLDTTIWMLEMAALAGGCERALRDFGFAFYYDAIVQNDIQIKGSPKIAVGILGNRSYNALVDDYLELGPQKKLYWNWKKFWFDWKTVYPDNKLLPEDYLARKTKNAFSAVQSDPKKQRLYGFFKAMLASGRFLPGSRFIAQDLGDLAFRYIDNKAYDLQRKWETKWWLFKWWKADEIRSLREKIAAAHVTGVSERKRIAGRAEEISGFIAYNTLGQNTLEKITGGPDANPIAVAEFLQVIGEQTARNPGPELQIFIKNYFDTPGSERSGSYFSALEALIGNIGNTLSSTRRAISDVSSELLMEHENNMSKYLECLYTAEPERDQLLSAAFALFVDPALRPDEYIESELTYSKAIQDLTLDGGGERLAEIAADLLGLLEYRLGVIQESRQQDLQLQLRQLRDRRLRWEKAIGELFETGYREWQSSAGHLAEMQRQWYQEFQNEYMQKQIMWEGRFQLMQRNRDQWVEESSRTAIGTAAQAFALEMGLDAERLIAEAQTITVPRIMERDLGDIVRDALPGATLSELLLRANRLNDKPGQVQVVLSAFLPQIRSLDPGMNYVREYTANLKAEIYSRTALITALQMRRSVEEVEEAVTENIAEANRNMEGNLGDTLQAAGYRRNGSEYDRFATIDSTLFGGMEDERQRVPAYRYFIAPAFDSGVDLSREALRRYSGAYIQSLVARAQENLSKYMELIFGRNEERKQGWDWDGINAQFQAFFEAQKSSFQASKGYNRKASSNKFLFHDIEGLFPYHIGYQPVMKQDSPEKVEQPGYGQLGIIMEAFLRNEARQARGLSMLSVPWYNLRMWDDDADNDGEADGTFGAPSVRSVAGLAVSIAATATGNVWLAAAVNLIDDAVFTIADVSSGYVGMEEGALSFGKQALIGAASAGVGFGFDAFSGTLGAFGEDAIGKTLLQGVETATNSAIGATIGAVNLNSGGELVFNTEQYKSALIGKEALIQYAGSMSGALVTNTLGEFDLEDTNGIRLGDTVFNTAQISAFNSLMGGLTTTAFEYGFSGETTVNLLNFRDLAQVAGLDWFRMRDSQGGYTDSWKSHGLLEMHVGGSGPRFTIGSAGTDLSATALAAGMAGLSESVRIGKFKWGEIEDQATLNAVNALAYTQDELNYTIGRRIFDSHIGVVFDNARGYAGYVDERDPTTMHVSRALLGTEKENAGQIAAFMAHEGTHILRPEVDEYGALLRGWNAFGDLMNQKQWLLTGSGFERTGMAVMARFVQEYGAANSFIASTMLGLEDHAVEEGIRPAEWFISNDAVGVKAYYPSRGPLHFLGELVPLNAWKRYQARKRGENVDREYLLTPNPEIDYQDLQNKDLRSVGLDVVDIILTLTTVGSSKTATTTGSAVKELLAAYFVPSFKSIKGVSGLEVVYNLLENTSSTASILDYADLVISTEQLSSLFRESKDYFQLSSDIASGKYDSFNDFKWYNNPRIVCDMVIFDKAKDLGIDFEVENRWRTNEHHLYRAVNEKMKIFMWLGEVMAQYNVTATTDLNMLYYGSVGPSVQIDGVDQYTFIPGFAELNNTMDLGWQDSKYYTDLLENIENLNTYKQMQQYAWGADPILFNTYSDIDQEMYSTWLRKGIDLQLVSEFDRYYDHYEDILSKFTLK